MSRGTLESGYALYFLFQVMLACGNAGQWEEAVSLLRQMSDRGVPPGVVNYSVAISACAKGRESETALSLLREMKADGVAPNAVT